MDTKFIGEGQTTSFFKICCLPCVCVIWMRSHPGKTMNKSTKHKSASAPEKLQKEDKLQYPRNFSLEQLLTGSIGYCILGQLKKNSNKSWGKNKNSAWNVDLH